MYIYMSGKEDSWIHHFEFDSLPSGRGIHDPRERSEYVRLLAGGTFLARLCGDTDRRHHTLSCLHSPSVKWCHSVPSVPVAPPSTALQLSPLSFIVSIVLTIPSPCVKLLLRNIMLPLIWRGEGQHMHPFISSNYDNLIAFFWGGSLFCLSLLYCLYCTHTQNQ